MPNALFSSVTKEKKRFIQIMINVCTFRTEEFFLPSQEKLMGHIASGLSVRLFMHVSVRPYGAHTLSYEL